MSKVVTKTIADVSMTPARQRRLSRLAAQPDSTIDLSEMPELDEAFFEKAVRNPFCEPTKKKLTVQLDADVVEWLREPGTGYQERMNAVLRKAMLNDRRQPRMRRAVGGR